MVPVTLARSRMSRSLCYWLLVLGFMKQKLSEPPPACPRKLGLLAGVFEDGSLSVYIVPYPPDLASTEPSSTRTPIYGRLSNAGIID